MVYSMIALVVVMNIFLTVGYGTDMSLVMDTFADAENVEDKKVQVNLPG